MNAHVRAKYHKFELHIPIARTAVRTLLSHKHLNWQLNDVVKTRYLNRALSVTSSINF